MENQEKEKRIAKLKKETDELEKNYIQIMKQYNAEKLQKERIQMELERIQIEQFEKQQRKQLKRIKRIKTNINDYRIPQYRSIIAVSNHSNMELCEQSKKELSVLETNIDSTLNLLRNERNETIKNSLNALDEYNEVKAMLEKLDLSGKNKNKNESEESFKNKRKETSEIHE